MKKDQASRELPEESGIRLNKALAEAGVASRRAADEMIAAGRVTVNGRPGETGMRVFPSDQIEVDRQPISRRSRKVYILLNKPKDTITSASDERGRRTVLDLVDIRDRVFPVGRLDRGTTGVLLLTNDGDLAFRLMHPSYGVERVYDAVLDREIALGDARKISDGVDLGDGERSQPCLLSVEHGDRRKVTVVLNEGRYHEVRRMFSALGYTVKRLNRTEYGGLTASGLRRGDWRFLSRDEVATLRALTRKPGPRRDADRGRERKGDGDETAATSGKRTAVRERRDRSTGAGRAGAGGAGAGRSGTARSGAGKGGPRSSESRSTGARSKDSRPFESRSSDSSSSGPRSSEPRMPGSRPKDSRPSDGRSSETRSSGSRSGSSRATGPRLKSSRPSDSRSSDARSSDARSTGKRQDGSRSSGSSKQSSAKRRPPKR